MEVCVCDFQRHYSSQLRHSPIATGLFKNNRSFGKKHPHKRIFDYSGEGLRRTNHTLSVLSFWIRWHDKSRRSERLRTAGLGDRVAFSLSLLSNLLSLLILNSEINQAYLSFSYTQSSMFFSMSILI